jgi:excisionase family DNA binding protein
VTADHQVPKVTPRHSPAVHSRSPGAFPSSAKVPAPGHGQVTAAVPPGIPEGLTVGQVARALNMKSETVKGCLSSGALPSWRVIEGKGWRYVRLADLAQFAERHGLPLYWSALL